MVRFTWAIAALFLKVCVCREAHGKWVDRWPHVNAFSELSARLAAAQREVNATEAAMARCAKELKAERDALAKTRSTVSSSEKDVLKGKNALQEAEVRRTELRGMVQQSGKDVSNPNALQSEEFEALSIFTERVDEEEKELAAAKRKLADQIGALKTHSGNKLSEVKAVKAELERIEDRTRVWEADKRALSEALAANNQSMSHGLPSQKELDELRELEQVIIPSVSSSIDTQEEIVASVMATLNATRFQLRACLESNKDAASPVVSSSRQSQAAKQQAVQPAKQHASHSIDEGEISAEQAAATDLGNILKDSSKRKDAEEDIEEGLHAELSVDEPYQPFVTAKSTRVDTNASHKILTPIPNRTRSNATLHAKKMQTAKPHGKEGQAPPTTSKSVKTRSTSQSQTIEALKAALAAPQKVAESLRGKLERSSPKHVAPHLPTFGEQIAGIMGH